MTSTAHHMAAMSSDEPRGYGAVGDARKRLEAQHQAHPDPAVCALMARAWDEGWVSSADSLSSTKDNPYRSAP